MIKKVDDVSLTLKEAMQRTGQENNFSAIKILAACMVVIAHSYPISGVMDESFGTFTKERIGLGGLAVQFFFAISGFLITHSVFRLFRKDPQKSIMRQAIPFFKKRCLRLFPSLIIVNIFVYFLVVPMFSTGHPFTYFLRVDPYINFLRTSVLSIVYRIPHLWMNNPLATEVNGSLWTLPVEFMCYVAVFFGVAWGLIPGAKRIPLGVQSKKRRRWLEKIGMLSAVLLFLFQPYLLSSGSLDFLHSWILTLCLLYYFSSLYYVYREKIVLNWKLFVVILFIYVMFYWFHLGVYTIIFLPYLIFCFAYALPKLSFLNRLGKYSYECYLVAWPIQQILVSFLGSGSPWKITFLTLPLMFLVAVGVSQLKDRFFYLANSKGLLKK